MLLTNSCFELVWLGAVIVSISCLALWIHLATLNIYTELRFIQMKTDFWLEWRFISLKLWHPALHVHIKYPFFITYCILLTKKKMNIFVQVTKSQRGPVVFVLLLFCTIVNLLAFLPHCITLLIVESSWFGHNLTSIGWVFTVHF